ncbi:MAG TPA: hypothetical protein DEQ02_10330 [Ruminococcaceae bacterium]|nr:hypothetical protein [Oscillospiraceae bacterium]
MTIKNLSQLKRAFKPGVKFEILQHNRSAYVGQIRRVTKVNSTSFYSVVDGEPEHHISKANNGLGAWCDFGAAKGWAFDADGTCTKYSTYVYTPNEVLIAFRVLEEVQHECD